MKSVPAVPSAFCSLLALSLVCLSPSAGFATQPSAEPPASEWLVSLEEATAAAREHDRYILVDLYAEWCGWCHKLERSVFSTAAFKEFARDFVLLRVDTEDKDEGTLLKARYGADSLPTMLVLDKDMVKVGAVSGYAPMPDYVSHVQEQIDGYLTLMTFYDQVLESGDADLQHNLAQDLHERGNGAKAARLYEKVLDQVMPQTGAEAWLLYQAADAWRMGKNFGAAERHMQRAYTQARALEDPRLIEQLDFLGIQLAKDAGDCQRTIANLERFLQEHPESLQLVFARRTLEAIKKGDSMECS